MLQSPWQTPLNAGFTLPDRHTVARGQLVFHSDFPLDGEQPLLDEVSACRDEVCRTLDLPLSDEPIHVYVFANAEKYESFMRLRRPGFPQTRAGFQETDHRLEVYVQWSERTASDMRHEIVHGCIHSVTPNAPLWLDEGLAEFFEIARGQQGLNREHVDELCDRLATGDWRPDLERLESLGPKSDMTRIDYAEAWGWVHLLATTRPDRRDLLRNYLRDLRQNGTAEPLSAGLRRLGGSLEEEFLSHIQGLTSDAH